jgi:hypothetical protein
MNARTAASGWNLRARRWWALLGPGEAHDVLLGEDHPFLKPHRANMKAFYEFVVATNNLKDDKFHVKNDLLRISIRLDSFQKSGQTRG